MVEQPHQPQPFPRLAEGSVLERDGSGAPVLRNDGLGIAVRIGELELRLLAQLDGRTPLSELKRGLELLCGQRVQQDTVRRLTDRLAGLGLVHVPPARPLRWLPEERVQGLRFGDCCRPLVGPLRSCDLRRLEWLPRAAAGEEPPARWLSTEDGGEPRRRPGSGSFDEDDGLFLHRGPSGACSFLEPDQRCRIHRVFGYAAKPAICRLFPLVVIDVGHELRVGSSLHCPAWAAAGGSPLAEEVARHGDLLLRAPLPVGRLTLLAPRGVASQPAPSGEAELSTGVEEELLTILGGAGRSAEGALALALRQVIALGGASLPQGITEERLLSALSARIQEDLQHVSPADAARLQPLAHLLARALRSGGDAEGVGLQPSRPEVDALYRRNLRGQLFLRFPLFAGGLAAGMALTATLHLLARLDAEQRSRTAGLAAPGPAEAGAGLRLAFLLAKGLDGDEDFAGIGQKALESLAEKLERLAGAGRGAGGASPGAG